MSYTALNGLIYLTKIISRGHIVSSDADLAEYWTCKQHSEPLFQTCLSIFAYYPITKVIYFVLNLLLQ